MIITEYHKKVFNAEICPYCNSGVKQVSETFVYGREYSGRKVIVCENYPKCEAYVGCHDNGTPLGRLADKKLRNAKIDAHNHFDKIWKEKIVRRGKLYKHLSDYLEIPIEYTHIGMFGIDTCKKVAEWSKERYKEINQI